VDEQLFFPIGVDEGSRGNGRDGVVRFEDDRWVALRGNVDEADIDCYRSGSGRLIDEW